MQTLHQLAISYQAQMKVFAITYEGFGGHIQTLLWIGFKCKVVSFGLENSWGFGAGETLTGHSTTESTVQGSQYSPGELISALWKSVEIPYFAMSRMLLKPLNAEVRLCHYTKQSPFFILLYSLLLDNE